MHRRLDIGKSAWELVEAFGDMSAMEAFRRCEQCKAGGDYIRAAEWRLVFEKVVQLQFSTPNGPLN